MFSLGNIKGEKRKGPDSQKSTSFLPVEVLVAFSKYEFKPVKTVLEKVVARWVMP